MKQKLLLRTGILSLVLYLVLPALPVEAQNMNVNPDKINLNAQGNAENIQCAYGAYLVSSNVTFTDIQIYFAGTYVCDAYGVDYCIIDNMVFVEFDWTTMISSPVLEELANQGQVVVEISGYFIVTDNNGEDHEYAVDRWGWAEVIKPGKRK